MGVQWLRRVRPLLRVWEAGGTFANKEMLWSRLYLGESHLQKVYETSGRVERLEAQAGHPAGGWKCGAEAWKQGWR